MLKKSGEPFFFLYSLREKKKNFNKMGKASTPGIKERREKNNRLHGKAASQRKQPCKRGKVHDFNYDGFCRYCLKPQCACGERHDFNYDGFCKYCRTPQCECGERHDFNYEGICRYCRKPQCACGEKHNYGYDDRCRYCGKKKPKSKR